MKKGGMSGVGQGFKVAMNILNNARFGLGSCAGASLRRVLGGAAEHANSRKQFGSPLAKFGLIQMKFGIMALDAYAIESMAFMTTGMIDLGDPSCEIEAAMCKVYGSEAAFAGINECIQLMGGTGFMKEWPFERLMRDRLSAVGKPLQNLLSDPSSVAKEVSDRLKRKLSPALLPVVHPRLRDLTELLQRLTAQFGDTVEYLLRKHKKKIIEEQIQLERIADSAMALFAMTASISRASSSVDAGIASDEHERKLTTLYCDMTSKKIATLLEIYQE
ncbi:hypothetical protein PsorP6_004145 [Peronosclerospora sorghi]|uniref:Uncharacterized protein n=1 Tax=Peronosclerospora sorghi TaxID=230839 RepID=A0ACC0VPV7_9STRA|nr:hypothetical protein PsorP6_004145 [Peronosclerospora sorghi]